MRTVQKQPANAAQPNESTALERQAVLLSVQGRSNILAAVSIVMRDTATLGDTLKHVIHSYNRHGDLIVARGAALRLVKALDVLIAHEEEAL
jgi:hypothetical protein